MDQAVEPGLRDTRRREVLLPLGTRQVGELSLELCREEHDVGLLVVRLHGGAQRLDAAAAARGEVILVHVGGV